MTVALADLILGLDLDRMLGGNDYLHEITLGIVFWTGLILPIFFLVFAPTPWEADRIQELELTELRADEAALGFLFWPLLAVMGIALMAGIWLLLLLGGVRFPPESLHEIPTALLLTMIGTATAGLLTLDFWISPRAKRWMALFLVPTRLLFRFGPIYFLYLLVIGQWPGRGGTTGAWLANGLLIVFSILWFLSRIDLTFQGLPARLYAASDAGSLLRVHPPSRAKAFWLNPVAARSAIWVSWNQWLRGAWIDALVLTGGTGLLVALIFYIEPNILETGAGGGMAVLDLAIFVLLTSLQFMGALIMVNILLRRLLAPSSIALISGGLGWSLMPFYLPGALLGIALSSGLIMYLAGGQFHLEVAILLVGLILITVGVYRHLAISALAAKGRFLQPLLVLGIMAWAVYLLASEPWPAISIVAALVLATQLFSAHEELRLFRQRLSRVPVRGISGIDDGEEFLVDDETLEAFKSKVLKQ
jgi:hypothetical protein